MASATLGFELKSNQNQDEEIFNLGMGVTLEILMMKIYL